MADGGQINLRLSLKGAEAVREELTKLGPAGSRALRDLDRSLRQPTLGLRALDAASGQVRNGLDDLAMRAGPTGSLLQQMGPWGLAAAAGLAALGLAAAAALNQAREAMRLADEMVAAADRIGVSTEALQQWEYVAGEADVESQSLRQNMERLNNAVGAFKLGIGEGRIRPIFEALGITEEQLDTVGDTTEMMMLLADRLGQVEDRAEQVRLARGLGIEESLPILRMGSEAIRELMEDASRLGYVIDNETTAALAEADRQMERAGIQMRVAATTAVAPLAGAMGGLAEDVGGFINRMRQVQEEAPQWVQTLLQLAGALGSTFSGGLGLLQLMRGGRGPKPGDSPEEMAAKGAALEAARSGGRPGAWEIPERQSGGGGSAAASAEAAARQAEQRRRALEDMAYQLDLEEARLQANEALVRELQRQNEERQLSRRLQDLGVGEEERAELIEQRRLRIASAMEDARNREVSEAEDQLNLEILALTNRFEQLRGLEREIELRDLIAAHVRRGLSEEDARTQAMADQERLEDARAYAAERWLDQAAEAHALELARLAGDRETTRELERQAWLRERSLELQRRGMKDSRAADEQAAREYAQLEAAHRRGLLREGIQDFLEGVRRGDLGGFFEDLADRFTNRLEERLADQLVPIFEQLAAMLVDALSGGGRGGGSGWGDFVGQVLGSFGLGGRGGGGLGPTGFSGANGKGQVSWNSAPALIGFDPTAHAVRAPEPKMAGGFAGPMKVELHNHGAEPMRAEARQGPDGSLKLNLYPLVRDGLMQAGRDGSLAKAAGLTPKPRRRG